AAGAAAAIVVDSVETRLEIARKMGATITLSVSTDNVSQIIDLTGGSGVHVAFECAGAVPAMQAAIRVTRSGGIVQLVGMPAEQEPTVLLYDIIGRELQVQGLFRYANTYPAAISLAAEGRVDLRSLVTKTFTLDEVPQAFHWVQEHREDVIKAVVRP
ncbi:MAG: zinc-binding dehydrogenase, partial [Bacteroidota bacterium]